MRLSRVSYQNMSESGSRKRSTYHVGNLAPLLLEEARNLLVEVGPAKLSVRAVSDRVGVSSTAAYHHFANKNALLCHLAAAGFRELHQALRHRPTTTDPQQALRNGCLAYFDFAHRNPQLYQLMFGPEFNTETMIPEYVNARDGAFGELKRIISEVLNLPVDSAKVFSSALASWSFTHGLADLTIHGVLDYPADNLERLMDKAMRGFEYLFERHL